MELADALLQGQIDAAIMKTSSIEMIDEMGDFTGFASDVKLIYSGEFTIKVATTEENVTDNYLSSDDVINVYISGIDSRGGINHKNIVCLLINRHNNIDITTAHLINTAKRLLCSTFYIQWCQG